ncbi:N-6 DNA methylase [Streptomyces sp. TRM66268-LWL]|uniref:site-specific DNA-methyltransferase (adenine-specific) n=1 Tax=Streptomyces polyasparticus TaxID=2767826 RepID=A0ABR7SQV9_9ACTN|nr:N-6 DNA methylase [Streptomyces polyasparticus]MBC9717784.1 N-6 DNA methylase [Streptomyces polyasparticus]
MIVVVQYDLFGEVKQKLEKRAEARETAAASPKPVVTRRRQRAFLGSPDALAHSIAENVTSGWFSHHGGGRMGIPLGTVATLTLLREPLIADWLLTLEPAQLPQFFKEVWAVQWLSRPDLVEAARPLHDWIEEEPDEYQLRAVQAVVHTSIHTGLLDLTAHDDPYHRSQADVLSPLLTGLRHKSDKKHRGEYHTPPSASDLMARVLIDSDTHVPGMTIREPALGSGGMFRSAAQTLRDRGLNPHDVRWFGNDIDRLSTACAAVNAIVWDLGPKVAIWCGNSLASPDGGLAKALTHRAAVIHHRNSVVEQAQFEHKARRMLDAFDRLLEGAPA